MNWPEGRWGPLVVGSRWLLTTNAQALAPHTIATRTLHRLWSLSSSMKNSEGTAFGRPNRVFILVAPGFDEEQVVPCLTQFRNAGVSASLVSLVSGTVTGAHGLALRADLTLERSLTAPPPRLVILSGGSACAAALLADPRVHHLMASAHASGGQVAALYGAQAALAASPLTVPGLIEALVRQNALDLQVFTEQLINQVLDFDE